MVQDVINHHIKVLRAHVLWTALHERSEQIIDEAKSQPLGTADARPQAEHD